MIIKSDNWKVTFDTQTDFMNAHYTKSRHELIVKYTDMPQDELVFVCKSFCEGNNIRQAHVSELMSIVAYFYREEKDLYSPSVAMADIEYVNTPEEDYQDSVMDEMIDEEFGEKK